MIRLARCFSDHAIFQRDKPIRIFGTADQSETIAVRLNDALVGKYEIAAGEFSITLPPQEMMQDATLTIGETVLREIDFGDVYLAAGQSNMAFQLRFASGWEEEKDAPDDLHLRMYTVGQYSYAGQREEGYKAWNPWDRWLPYTRQTRSEFSAVATFFAKELRKNGVPIGILNLSWGGTSASAWIDRAYLAHDAALSEYLTDFEALTDAMDMAAYAQVKPMIRRQMSSPDGMRMMDGMMLHTVPPEEVKKQGEAMPPLPPFIDPSKVEPERFLMWGPGDQNEPGALYEHMVKEVAGFTCRAVLWYQGESDCYKDRIYDKLLAALIDCFRSAWGERLPFFIVQLAPYGVWAMNPPEDYTLMRMQQEKVVDEDGDAYLAVITDIGNIYDIHPKVKEPVGVRLSYLVRKYLDGELITADAPKPEIMERTGRGVRILFRDGEGLRKEERDFSAYNGFPAETLPKSLLPPITDGVNALSVRADGVAVDDISVSFQSNVMELTSDHLSTAEHIRVDFAKTPFYEVNVYSGAGLPVRPFSMEI